MRVVRTGVMGTRNSGTLVRRTPGIVRMHPLVKMAGHRWKIGMHMMISACVTSTVATMMVHARAIATLDGIPGKRMMILRGNLPP